MLGREQRSSLGRVKIRQRKKVTDKIISCFVSPIFFFCFRCEDKTGAHNLALFSEFSYQKR